MEALKQLFDELSRDFTNGSFKTHLETTILPTTMYVADAVIFTADQDELLKNLTMFRNNLIELGFVRVETEILNITQSHRLSARAVVRWHFVNKEDEAISSNDLTYYCTHMEAGWRIALTETPNPLDPNVSGGLPIA